MQRKIIGIDPGTNDGAFVVWNCSSNTLIDKGILPNLQLLDFLKSQLRTTEIFCEMIASYGMAVGQETFETCVWIGRAEQICLDRDHTFTKMYRIAIKTHHCHSVQAKDSNLRQALIDRFGKVGTRKAPGPLFGVATHIWSALAVATYASDTTANLTKAYETEKCLQ